jgi:hypothetical protein
MSLPSEPSGGVATTNVESIATLPPLALLRALAEIRLSLPISTRSKPCRVMLAAPSAPLVPVAAVMFAPLRDKESAVI